MRRCANHSIPGPGSDDGDDRGSSVDARPGQTGRCAAVRPRPRRDVRTARPEVGHRRRRGVASTSGPASTSGWWGSPAAASRSRRWPSWGCCPSAASRSAARSTTRAATCSPRASRTWRELRGRDIAMVFQDPMSSLNPVVTIGIQLDEVIRGTTKVDKREARDRAEALLRRGRDPRPRPPPAGVPAPALGRDAAAGADRHRAGLRAQAADRRRAHHRARRDDPGAGPGGAQGAGGRDRRGAADDHPRPRRGRRVCATRSTSCTPAGSSSPPRAAGCSPHRATPTPAASSRASRGSTRLAATPLRPIPGSPTQTIPWTEGCAFAPRCRNKIDRCTEASPRWRSCGDRQLRCFNPLPPTEARGGRNEHPTNRLDARLTRPR